MTRPTRPAGPPPEEHDPQAQSSSRGETPRTPRGVPDERPRAPGTQSPTFTPRHRAGTPPGGRPSDSGQQPAYPPPPHPSPPRPDGPRPDAGPPGAPWG